MSACAQRRLRCRLSPLSSTASNLRPTNGRGSRASERASRQARAGYGAAHQTPVYARDALAPGVTIDGPAIISEAVATTIIEPGWRATMTERGDLVIERVVAADRVAAIGTDVDPVMLEVFNNLYMSIAEQMGVTLQNTAYALARRYSRGHLRETYSTSSVLLVMELAKLWLSMGMIVYAGAPSDVPEGSAMSKYCFLIRHSQKMMVPAAVYLVMNILGFVALGHIDAATFSIIAQMKVFTTATFSVLMLDRSLAPRKWRALTTLVIGACLAPCRTLARAASAPRLLLLLSSPAAAAAAAPPPPPRPLPPPRRPLFDLTPLSTGAVAQASS